MITQDLAPADLDARWTPNGKWVRLDSTRSATRGGIESGRYADRLSDPATQKRLAKALKRWTRRTDPLIEAVRASERLTDKDFAIRINAKG